MSGAASFQVAVIHLAGKRSLPDRSKTLIPASDVGNRDKTVRSLITSAFLRRAYRMLGIRRHILVHMEEICPIVFLLQSKRIIKGRPYGSRLSSFA